MANKEKVLFENSQVVNFMFHPKVRMIVEKWFGYEKNIFIKNMISNSKVLGDNREFYKNKFGKQQFCIVTHKKSHCWRFVMSHGNLWYVTSKEGGEVYVDFPLTNQAISDVYESLMSHHDFEIYDEFDTPHNPVEILDNYEKQ